MEDNNNMKITYTRDYAKIVIIWDAEMFECEVDTVGLTQAEEAAFWNGNTSILEGAGFLDFACEIA